MAFTVSVEVAERCGINPVTLRACSSVVTVY